MRASTSGSANPKMVRIRWRCSRGVGKSFDNEGRTYSSSMASISRGTPGRKYKSAWLLCRWNPGAVPFLLAMTSLLPGRRACFSLRGCISLFQARKRALICLSALSLRIRGRSKAWAAALAVRSSSVGPRPPVTMTASCVLARRCNAAAISSLRSLTVAASCTGKELSINLRAIAAVLVSARSPFRSSSPMVRIAIFIESRAFPSAV